MKRNRARNKPEKISQYQDTAKRPSEGTHLFIIDRLYGENAKWLIAAVLVLGCVAIYFQTSDYAFVNLDDNEYVYRNPQVLSGLSWQSMKWAFSTFHAANWHPLTWISLEFISSVFGTSARAFHVANLAFHTFNSVFLYFLIFRLSRSSWKSALVAAIFAFHPAHVESVAWVAEHKDVLSTAFFLLTCWFYVSYTRAERPRLNYFLAIIAFTLGLMAKPMLVTMPFILLLLDYWPLERLSSFSWKELRPLIVEKIPLFCLTVISSIATFQAQKAGGAVVELTHISLSDRVSNSILSYLWYIATFFYPVRLGGWYPFSDQGFSVWQVTLAAAVLIAISLYVIYERDSRKYLVTGWFWFIGALVPVIGFVQVGRQAHADRYTYIPYIGLSIVIVWLAPEIVDRFKINVNFVGALAAAILLVSGILSFRQVGVWKDSESFYRHTLAVTSRNYLFEQNYCQFLLDAERLDEAETQCRNSIANNAEYANAWNSLGIIRMKKGDYDEARADFEKASRLRPANLEMYSNYINSLIALEQLDEAENKVNMIANSNTSQDVTAPYLFSLYRALGFAFAQKGDKTRASDNLQKANAIKNDSDEVHKALGLLLYATEKPVEAVSELDRSLALNPNQADIQSAIGKILLSQGKKEEAIKRFESALAIDPNMQSAADGLKDARAGK
jgi:tetratricopeptide (TPR) repeat protein